MIETKMIIFILFLSWLFNFIFIAIFIAQVEMEKRDVSEDETLEARDEVVIWVSIF